MEPQEMAQETVEALGQAAKKALGKVQELEMALEKVKALELRVSELEMALDSARSKLMAKE
jgi:hypothetical protein